MNQLPPATTHHVRVLATADVGPRMRRITVGGSDLADFEPLPGQDLVVHLTDDRGNGVRRRYTIRNLDRAAERFDLDVVVHGHGPGSMWGTTARIGDAVEIFGPRGKVRLAEAGWQLFVGDESALPAISEMLLALPDTANVVALIEIQDAADEQLLSSPAHLDLRWLHRGATLAGSAQPLVSALARVELVNPDRHAYVFGESRVVKQLRDDLAGRGFRPDQVSAKGYWNMFARHARSEGNHHVT